MKNSMEQYLDDTGLVETPVDVTSVVVVCDTSISMTRLINALNAGIRMNHECLLESPITRYNTEVSYITFGETARVGREFSPVDKSQPFEASIAADGGRSNHEAALRLGLDTQMDRREHHRAEGTTSKSWLVFLTDGERNMRSDPQAVEECARLARDQRLVVIPVAIGKDADLEFLKAIRPEDVEPRLDPIRINTDTDAEGLSEQFLEFFKKLSASLVSGTTDALQN